MENSNNENITIEDRKEWMYDAFISYRHIEPDAYVAGAIHKLLESYNPPKSIFKGKDSSEIKRTKIKKVFRDQEELPLTSNLSDTISMALENSEYLIVICSPRFGESLWCRKEVDTFISLHGKEKVLTVLVDGEPSESFPEVLLYKEVETIGEDGSTQIVKEPIEPLAANARGNNNKERYKLLKTESLRLMAPMFGVNFDDLKQRHKEQKLKRTIQIVAAAAGLCFLFGVVSTSMALKINRQNAQITSQNNQILEQNDQISKQSEQIKKQYEEALISNGVATTKLAKSQYSDGDRVKAIKTAYSVFPHEGADVPFIQATQDVLTDALALYDYGDTYRPDRIVKAGSVIIDCVVSPNGKCVAVTDEAFDIHVWDASNGKLLMHKNAGDMMFADNYNVTFKNDTQIYTTIDNAFVLYDIEKDEVIFEFSGEGKYKSFYNERTDRVLIYSYDEVYLADGTTGKIIAAKEDDGEGFWSNNVDEITDIRSASANYYAYVTNGDSGSNTKHITVCSLVDGSIVKSFDANLQSISKVKIYGDNLLIVENYVPEGYSSMDTSSYEANLYNYDIISDGNEPKWTYKSRGSYGYDAVVSGAGNYVAYSHYASLDIIDAQTGELKRQYSTDQQIQTLLGFVDNDMFAIVTRKGALYTASIDYEDLIEASFFKANVENLKLVNLRGGIIATVPYGSVEMTLYKMLEQERKEKLFEIDEYVTWMDISDDGSKVIAYTYDSGSVEIDRQTGEAIASDALLNDEEDEELEALKDSYIESLGIAKKAVASSIADDKGRLFVINYKDKSFDIYRIDANSKVMPDTKEHFESHSLFDVERIETNDAGNMVWIDFANYGIILDLNKDTVSDITPSEEMIIAGIKGCRFVDFESKYVYCTKGDEISRFPLYTKEDISDLAKNVIDTND